MGAFRMTAAALVALSLVLTSCAPPPPQPKGIVLGAVDPSFLHGTDHRGIDRLAATVVTEVQRYWARAFPANFDTPWRELDGGFFSVNTTHSTDQAPPCAADSREVEGNAYYCATVDAIAWDRAALLPVLREHYGEAAVAVVLAHELGHAVAQRIGMDLSEVEQPIRLETAADCYAGSFIRWVSDEHSQRLRINDGQLDSALRALTVFRDPIGTTQSEVNAHGTAFQRAAAFQDGFRNGPGDCATAADAGNPPTEPGEHHESLPTIVHSPGMRSFFSNLVPGWNPPKPRFARNTPKNCTGDTVAYCAHPATLLVDRGSLTKLHTDIGDQASATVLASRFALAAIAAQGRPTTGRGAGEQATCLTGAYTVTGAHGALSPGDLDAAVRVLLATEDVSADAAGSNELTGFDRIAAFRAGATGGIAACRA